MDRIRYKLTSKRLNGFLLVTYINGYLKSILIEVKDGLNEVQWYHLASLITATLQKLNLKALQDLNIEITAANIEDPKTETVELMPASTRIAMFCAAYRKKNGINYRATKSDGGKLKHLPIAQQDFEPLLNTYMQSEEWYLNPKSIANFIGKINEIRLLANNPNAGAKKVNWPIPFDAGYNNTLTDDKRQLYYAALREAGYVYRDIPGRPGKWELKEVKA